MLRVVVVVVVVVVVDVGGVDHVSVVVVIVIGICCYVVVSVGIDDVGDGADVVYDVVCSVHIYEL